MNEGAIPLIMAAGIAAGGLAYRISRRWTKWTFDRRTGEGKVTLAQAIGAAGPDQAA